MEVHCTHTPYQNNKLFPLCTELNRIIHFSLLSWFRCFDSLILKPSRGSQKSDLYRAMPKTPFLNFHPSHESSCYFFVLVFICGTSSYRRISPWILLCLSSSDILSSSSTDSCVFTLFSLVLTDGFLVVPALSMPTTCVSSCTDAIDVYNVCDDIGIQDPDLVLLIRVLADRIMLIQSVWKCCSRAMYRTMCNFCPP